MKKIILTVLAILLSASVFTGCSGGGEKEITAISRESGSGTRSAFMELIGLSEEELDEGLICDKTNNVITAVANDKYAIGYISLGSLNDSVKALKIGGVAATTENIIAGSYIISRPFIIVHKESAALSPIAQDFKEYLESAQAQAIITQNGYVSTVQNAAQYTAVPGMGGKLSLNGSTSVSPLIIALAAGYISLNGNVSASDITISQTGSSAGISAAMDNTCDFGMSSREIKAAETGLAKMQLCKDGIAVIVNKENPVGDLTKEILIKIYKGEIKRFSEIG